MANKRICDRCKANIEEGSNFGEFTKPMYAVSKKSHIFADRVIVDLCDKCYKELSDWMANKEKGCQCNRNVLEVLDQLESAEKHICELSGDNERLAKENEMLKSGVIKELLDGMDISVSVSIKKKEE